MSFFIADAYAAAPAAAEPSAFANIAMLVVFMLVFYFLLWRPQQKRQKEQQPIMTGIQKGDEIVFAGGLFLSGKGERPFPPRRLDLFHHPGTVWR